MLPFGLDSFELDSIHYLVGGASLFVLCCYIFRRRDLDHIPTIGYSDPFLSILSSIRYLSHGREIGEEGYKKYPNHMFKISTFDGWNVIVNGKDRIDDMRRATNEQMSSMRSTADLFQLNHTIGARITDNPYHNEVIRSAMTKNIENRFDEIHDEVVQVYSELIKAKEDGKLHFASILLFADIIIVIAEWTSVVAYPMQVNVASRVNTRYFFGKPLSDDHKFLTICERATEELFKGRFTRYFPELMRPLLARLITDARILRRDMEGYLRPIVEQRLEQEKLHEIGYERPNDLVAWLMDGLKASGDPVTVEDISARVLLISFGAIHTMSASVTNALYTLCLNPQVVGDLRDEVESVVEEHGWTKASLDKMHKVDSFLRESQRLHFMFHFTMTRTTMKPITFSDGTTLPKDTTVVANLHSRHRNDDTYPDAETFNAFRFVKDPDTTGPRPLLVTPTLDYLAWGHGRPACPGRFYAVAELKTIFAHVVTTYDLKLEKDEYPAPIYMEANAFPNANTNILFRKRRRPS